MIMCVTYFEIGRMIVEEEQSGKARAEYGKKLLTSLSAFLNERIGKGFSVSTLSNARKFYKVYAPSISQTMFTKLPDEKSQTMFAQLENSEKSQTLFTKLANNPFGTTRQTLFTELYPFTLSWSHYLVLMRIKNDAERRFYEIEATQGQWDVRRLQRQYGSSLYERLALSREKDAVMKLASEGQTIEKPQDLLKNPLSLEFLGMEEKPQYSESDLESSIISKLQQFLLELGKGFLYEARQKRFTFN